MIWGLSKQTVGVLLVIVSSLCFAVVPNSGKIALNEGASLFVLIITRYAIGAVLLLPVVAFSKATLRVPPPQRRRLIITSIYALLLLMATYHAVYHLDIGLVLLILYSFPIGVALIARVKGKEHLSPRRWLCMGLVMVGLGIMIIDGIGDINLYGVFISVLGLIAFVLFIDTSSELAVEIGSSTLNLYISLTGLVVLALAYGVDMTLGIAMGSTATGSTGVIPIAMPDSGRGITAIWTNGVFYIVSWVMFFEGAQIIGATRAALMACVEPLFAALLALVLLGQHLSVVEWTGFFIVLGAITAFERLANTTTR